VVFLEVWSRVLPFASSTSTQDTTPGPWVTSRASWWTRGSRRTPSPS